MTERRYIILNRVAEPGGDSRCNAPQLAIEVFSCWQAMIRNLADL